MTDKKLEELVERILLLPNYIIYIFGLKLLLYTHNNHKMLYLAYGISPLNPCPSDEDLFFKVKTKQIYSWNIKE